MGQKSIHFSQFSPNVPVNTNKTRVADRAIVLARQLDDSYKNPPGMILDVMLGPNAVSHDIMMSRYYQLSDSTYGLQRSIASTVFLKICC